MKNKLSFKIAVWWIVLSAVIGIFLLIVSDKQARESDEENRMLAGFPNFSVKSVADASFMNGFDDFLSDAFIGRSSIKNFTSRVTGMFNTLSADEKMAQKVKNLEQQMRDEGVIGGEDDGASADEEEFIEPEEEIIADDGFVSPENEIYVTVDTGYLTLTKLDGTKTYVHSYKLETIAQYAENLKLILGFLPADGHIYFARSPVADTAHRWTTQTDTYCGWKSTMENLLQSCTNNDRIHIFNVPAILEPHLAAGEDTYYVTDHHWTAKGAYYVAHDMLRYQGLPVAPYEEFEYKYNQSSANDAGQTDTFDILYPLLPTKSLVITKLNKSKELPLMDYERSTYRAFMNNSRTPWRRIITGVNVGRNALIISDSFGNAFAPYLLPYYDEVHMVDFRYDYFSKAEAGGNISELMKYYGIDDVYVIISTTNDVSKDNSLKYLRKFLVD